MTNQQAVNNVFAQEKPEYVFLAAAKVGGILANSTYLAEFIYENLMIEENTIYAAYKTEQKNYYSLVLPVSIQNLCLSH